MAGDARAAKKALRQQIHARLSALDESTLATQSRACQHTVISMREYEEAMRIAIYLAMPHGEMRTDDIVRDALAKGKKVFVPYLYPIDVQPETGNKRKAMTMLRLESEHEYAHLPQDSWGIPSLPADSINDRENAQGGRGLPEPIAPTSTGGLDLIVVPGVAFDVNMGRLGHGGGFYDRFLSRYKSSQPSSMPFMVGMCLQEQMLPAGQIEMETWDWKMDAIVDGTGRVSYSSKAV